jgi:hypothetical protein
MGLVYIWYLFINCPVSQDRHSGPVSEYGVNSSRDPVDSEGSGCAIKSGMTAREG